MKRHWRYRSFAFVTIVLFGAIGAYFAADWYNQPPPNYSLIEDGLYMGGDEPKPPRGTKAVLNLCQFPDPYTAEVHRWEPIPDAAPAPSLDWLRQQVEFISEQRQEGRTVFVHCRAGVSRSGMVVTAYLMSREGWSRDEAFAYVRSRRPEVHPNPAFMELLLDWERSQQTSRR